MILVKSQVDLDEAIMQAEMYSDDLVTVRIYLSKINGEPPEMIDSDFTTHTTVVYPVQVSPKPSPSSSFPFIGIPSVKASYRPKRISECSFFLFSFSFSFLLGELNFTKTKTKKHPRPFQRGLLLDQATTPR